MGGAEKLSGGFAFSWELLGNSWELLGVPERFLENSKENNSKTKMIQGEQKYLRRILRDSGNLPIFFEDSRKF